MPEIPPVISLDHELEQIDEYFSPRVVAMSALLADSTLFTVDEQIS